MTRPVGQVGCRRCGRLIKWLIPCTASRREFIKGKKKNMDMCIIAKFLRLLKTRVADVIKIKIARTHRWWLFQRILKGSTDGRKGCGKTHQQHRTLSVDKHWSHVKWQILLHTNKSTFPATMSIMCCGLLSLITAGHTELRYYWGFFLWLGT